MGTLAFLSQLLLVALSIFLMIVILLQRGRGGGLAGAFGGLGGQSAFGTKAGDVFTKITVVLASAWVIVAGGSGYFLRAVDEGTRAQDLGEVSAPGMSAPEEREEGEIFGTDLGSSTGTDDSTTSDDADGAADSPGGESATGTSDADTSPADENSSSPSDTSDADRSAPENDGAPQPEANGDGATDNDSEE